MLNAELDAAIAQFIRQWNIAEQRIKRAEQVRANEVVSSAIFELRYAGRKIVDALDICLRANIETDGQAREKVHAYIADATEDCVKAKHDAIDSMMDFVTIWFHEVEKSLSLTKVQQLFPNYLETTALIAGIQERIAESRKDRNTLRDSIYDQIDGDGYEQILRLFNTMRISKERIGAEINKERREKAVLRFMAVGGFIFGLLGAINIAATWLIGPPAANNPSKSVTPAVITQPPPP